MLVVECVRPQKVVIMQKRIVMGLLASAALSALALSTGCATLTMTAKEDQNQIKDSWNTDLHAMADDWNMIWMTDHQTTLTRWHTR